MYAVPGPRSSASAPTKTSREGSEDHVAKTESNVDCGRRGSGRLRLWRRQEHGGRRHRPRPGVATGEGGKALKSAGGSTINIEAHNRWKEGVAGFKTAEKSGWTKERCESVAEDFEDAADAQNKFAEARVHAGSCTAAAATRTAASSFTIRRCGRTPSSARRAAALASKLATGSESSAQSEFEGAVRDELACTEGYVNIAMMQMARSGASSEEALNNLRRALAIDAQYLPAFNQMALFTCGAPRTTRRCSTSPSVVCRQAQA